MKPASLLDLQPPHASGHQNSVMVKAIAPKKVLLLKYDAIAF